LTGDLAEFDLHHMVLELVYRQCPTQAGLALRAGDRLLFPVNNKIAGCKTGTLFGLSMIVASGRPN
jgi:hypothetical protein